MENMVIYKEGEMNIQTFINSEGKPAYCKDITLEAYLAEKGPEYKVISWNDAIDKITEVQNIKLIKPFVEISEDQYWDYLECLPPEKWQTIKGVQIFRMSEYSAGNITQHCAKYKDRYFAANRRTSIDYADIAKEIKEIVG